MKATLLNAMLGHPTFRWQILAAMLGFTFSCGGDLGESSAELSQIEAFCAAMEVANCESLKSCLGADDEDCDMSAAEQSNVVARMCTHMRAAVAAGTGRFNVEAAVPCLEALEVWHCESTVALFPMPCSDVLEPLARSGDSCTRDLGSWFSVCAEGYCRADPANPCRGVCAPTAAVGERCGVTARHTPCDFESAACDQNGVCRQFSAVGEPCGSSSECSTLLGHVCEQDASSTETVCRQIIYDEGASCDASHRCRAPFSCVDSVCSREISEGDSCRSDHFCPEGTRCLIGESTFFTDRTCQPLSNVGESCNIFDRSPCVAGTICRRIDEVDTARCVGALGVGDACNQEDSMCGPGLWCGRLAGESDVATQCHAPQRAGEACNANPSYVDRSCEQGSYCHLGVCRQPGGIGAPCPVHQPWVLCSVDTICNVNGECVARPVVGAACNPNGDIFACSFPARCECDDDCESSRQDQAVTPGVCVAPRSPGETCTSSIECGWGLCVESVCIAGEAPLVCPE